MAIIMRADIVKTIKETLEESNNITILALNEIDNVLFGVYINDVKEKISFLSEPKVHFETTIDNINLQFFELGALLYNIYFHGALKFIDILCSDNDLLEPNQYYVTLCNFVLENIPFNVAKLKYITAVDEDFKYPHDNDKVLMLTQVMRDFRLTLLLNDDFTEFKYVKSIDNKNDFILACNELNEFKNELQAKTFSKISEKNMHRLDDMYTNLQILHIKV